MRVLDVMTRPAVTVGVGSSVHDVAALMSGRGFTAVPVVDAGRRLIGVVSEADVLRDRVHHDPRSPHLLGQENLTAPPGRVGEVMSRQVHSVTPTTDTADAAALMTEHHLRSVPVVDRDEVVGVVTRRDLVRVIGRDDAELATAVACTLNHYAGWARWQVHVTDGVVRVCDDYDDPIEQHIATMIAAAEPGAVHVEARLRQQCQYHGSGTYS